MMNIPKPNSIVSVTTKHRNYSYYSKEEFQYSTYRGKVLKPPSWVVKAGAFCLETDNPKCRTSIINMKYVVSLEHLA